LSQLLRILYISRKDVESYYSKPPLITWGLLFPAVLILAMYVKDPETYLDVAPGIIAMTLLFGCTSMAAIVITFEKRCGTFQRLLLAPVTYRTILLGKAVSAAAYGLVTSLILTLGLTLLLGMPMVNPLALGAGLLLGAAIFSLLGLIASVMVREVFEAMTLMNFFRFPILFVSGVFVPLAEMPGWSRLAAFVSPLTYVVELLRFGVSGRGFFDGFWLLLSAATGFVVLGWFVAELVFRHCVNRV
jgi:ABC-2 type transport system permease protein